MESVGNGVGGVGVVDEILLGGLATLAQAHILPAEPGTALLDDARLDTHVDEFALAADATAVDDVKLGLAEGWGDLVLDDLDTRLCTQDALAVLDVGQTADVEAHAAVELQRVTAGGRLGIAEQHAQFFPQLVDEDTAGACLGDGGGEFPQCLAH